jgi:hypothetical protein
MKTIFVAVALLFLFAVPHVAGSPSAMTQNDSSYIDSAGSYHVVGEVLNTGDAWLRFTKVTGTLKNSGGGIVDVLTSYAYAEYLPPEARSPFELIELDAAKSATVTSYSLALEFDLATIPPGVNLAVEGLTSSTDSAGNLNLLGQVRNTGLQQSNFTKLYATFYDSAGKVIYVDFTYTSPSTIPAGQVSSFKFIGPAGSIASHVSAFTVGAESDQYTSVAEFPWTVVLVAALTLGVVVFRKKSRRP